MDDHWTYVEGKRQGRAYTAGVRTGVGPQDWPGLDCHVAITLDYGPHWRTGLPRPKELTRLQDFEDSTIEHLEGHGVMVGSETTGARRTVHLFVRDGGGIAAMYRDAQARGKQGGVAVQVAHDPAWANVAHLTRLAQRRAG